MTLFRQYPGDIGIDFRLYIYDPLYEAVKIELQLTTILYARQQPINSDCVLDLENAIICPDVKAQLSIKKQIVDLQSVSCKYSKYILTYCRS